MTEFIEVQTTIDSKEAAQKIADTLVSKHLAACVQISGPIFSTYWWQGNIEQAQEWRCTAKTRKELYSKIEEAIKEVHSYDVPEILAIAIDNGIKGYTDWIAHETDANTQR